MNFSDIFKKGFLASYTSENISVPHITAVLLITAAIAAYIFIVYRLITKKTFYSKNFNIALAGIAVVTAGIILAVQSSIVISLGMVGALSIVRFRTAIKEPMDLCFLFWSIAAGIVLAAGLIPLAVFGSVCIGVILLVFVNKKSYLDPYILVLRCDGGASAEAAHSLVERQVRRCVLKSKTVQPGEVELNLEIRMKGADTGFVNTLGEMEGVRSAVLVSYNGDYLG